MRPLFILRLSTDGFLKDQCVDKRSTNGFENKFQGGCLP